MPKYRRKHKVPLEFVNPNLKAMMDGVKLKKQSLAYRHELLLHHQRINYENEKDRLKGILDRGHLPMNSITQLQNRRANLKDMIDQNLYPIRH
jgi:hypothetical protein